MSAVIDKRQSNDYSDNPLFLLDDITSTSSSEKKLESNLSAALDMTTGGISDCHINTIFVRVPFSRKVPQTEAISSEITRKAVHELKKLTGFTWEQIAQLFKVSRRTIHFWGSGQRLNSSNEEHLNLLLDTIKYINRGIASQNRNLLLKESRDRKRYFDLLVAGEYQRVKDELGAGNAPKKIKASPLSEEARQLRRPPSPDTLVDALQDPIHRSIGRSRPAKSVRSRKDSSGKSTFY
jgi:hypothetical protein